MNKKIEIKTVSIIGAGSWGTSIAKVIAETYPQICVKIWAFEKSVASSINSIKENSEYLPGIQIPENISASSNLKEATVGSEVVIIATPSKVIYEIAQKISNFITNETHVGYLSKGFCKIHNEILTISQAIEKAIPFLKGKVIAISGPSHAEEVSNRFHTCLNIGGTKVKSRKIISELLSTDYLQCRETDDIIGVEVGGTLKNPAAIAAGMISILPNCGDNLTGALISEALKEMIELAKVFNVKEKIILDISGLGDLVATSLSRHSRNRRFGRDISNQIMKKGKTLNIVDRIVLKFKPENVIERISEKFHYLAEGAYAIEPLIELAEANNISIPVYRSLYEVLLNKKDPALLIETIKNPEKFDEIYFNTKIQISDRKKGLEKVEGKVFKDIIVDRTLEKFINEDDSRNTRIYDIDDVIRSIKSLMISKTLTERLGNRELSIIKELNRVDYIKSIRSLSEIYINSIADNLNSAIKWIFIKYLKTMSLSNIISQKKGKISISGMFDDIRKIKTSVNIIYVSTIKSLYDSIFLILSINRKKLPFPRYFVSRSAIKNKRERFFIKLSGGFIIDKERLTNIVYRESLCQYLLTLLEHGVPILYFPDFASGENIDPNKNDFFSTITESLYMHTVEIALIPIEITYIKRPERIMPDKNSFRKILKNRLHVNFSKPIFLSDYTKQPHLILGLSRVIKTVWKNDSKIFPHLILCRVLADNNFHVRHDSAEKLLKEYIRNNDLRVNYSSSKILKKGLNFLTASNTASLVDGVIVTKNHQDVEFYADMI